MFEIIIAIAVLAIAGGALWAFREQIFGGGSAPTLFGSQRERRLNVVESANVDGRRRLVLVQRDGVEHLVMIGGPIDVVIETGIGRPRQPAAVPNQRSGGDVGHTRNQGAGGGAAHHGGPGAGPTLGSQGGLGPQGGYPSGYNGPGQRPAPAQPSRGPNLGGPAPTRGRVEPTS